MVVLKHGRSNERNKWTDRNGEICSRAIRQQICDLKEGLKTMIVSRLMYGSIWSTGMVPT